MKREKELNAKGVGAGLVSARKERGITLIALVITIIVLLILAGVTIAMVVGDNGILSRAKEASVDTEIAGIEEEANVIFASRMMDNNLDGGGDVLLSDIIDELREKGYTIESILTGSVTGIKLDKESLMLSAGKTGEIQVSYEGSEEGTEYYALLKGKYYKITKESDKIKIDRKESTIDKSEQSSGSLEVTSSNSCVTATLSGKTVKLEAGSTGGTSTITVSYGEFSKTCTVTVVITPLSDADPSNSEPTFSTEYGLIDVIWLKDGTNTVASTPNAPNLYTGDEKLTPVTWTENSDTWTEDDTAKSTWYNYSSATGTEDSKQSMWANAKNKDGSYFVWIPRYAYRITYYSDANHTKLTGCYDGIGLWDATTGNISYKIDEGIETVDYNGMKYIVHPAFVGTNGKSDEEAQKVLDNGGWDKDLTGFWVAKYEMSRENATATNALSGYSCKFKSVPDVQSARIITIGNMFDKSKEYDNHKESHLMKNSEWGAVAYLTHSKYGRNGHEIDINNSSSYITGNGGGSPSASSSATKNAFNTKIGAGASTTGNVYGIYDMSGGAWEYTAGFDSQSTNSYLNSNGSSFVGNDKKSTKYATAYSNGTSDCNSVSTIYTVSKIGDAIKEVKNKNSSSYGWFSDYSYVVNSDYPFSKRGGDYNGGSGAGVFCADNSNGFDSSSVSFRVVLGE